MNETIIGGMYKHYKGTKIKVLGIVQHSETLEEMVHYVHLDDGTSWVRPIDMFLETIEINGKTIQRFKLVEKYPLAKPHKN